MPHFLLLHKNISIGTKLLIAVHFCWVYKKKVNTILNSIRFHLYLVLN